MNFGERTNSPESARVFDNMSLVFAPSTSVADIDPIANLHLIKLLCDNYGYVLLLNTSKVGLTEQERCH